MSFVVVHQQLHKFQIIFFIKSKPYNCKRLHFLFNMTVLVLKVGFECVATKLFGNTYLT